MDSRNKPLGFATRTRKNFEYIEAGFEAGKDVHVVAQLANSLLGLIVFPWEGKAAAKIESLSMTRLTQDGWPEWEVLMGDEDTKTLGDLMYHLRNAIAHRHIVFSSDSRYMEEVFVSIEDFKPHATAPYWRARIGAKPLRDFCLRFIKLLEVE